MAKPTKAAVVKRLALIEQASRPPWDPRAILYDYQLAVHDDPTRDRVFSGTRQLGKSLFAAEEIIDAGILNPGADIAYVDMDILHGERIVWERVEKLMRENQVPAKISDGALRFYNGATGYIFSGRPAEIEKLQGFSMALLIIDESQDAEALDKIITLVRPALMRFKGRILLLGIPGRVAQIGPWWDATEGKAKGNYGQHRATFWQNKSLPDEAKAEQYETAKIELGETSPDFIRLWKGEWPSEDNALRVCRYFPEVNGYDGDAPALKFHSLGLDPGGTLDAEAVVVVGWGNQTPRGDADGLIYAIAEDVSEKRQGGDWDVTGERVGPLDAKYRPETKFLDYGSARKSGVIVKYQKDVLITLDAVPQKDPEQEFMRINQLLQARRLFVKRGSQIHRDMMYTTLDPGELSKGKYVLSRSWKQNSLDALRAALWGVEGYTEVKAPRQVYTEAQIEQQRLEKAAAFKPKPQSIETAADKLLGPNKTLADVLGVPKRSSSRVTNPYGLPGR